MVTEVKIYVLVLNTFGAAEEGRIVAVSSDYQTLIDWYKSQFADKPYKDGVWLKHFKPGSLTECNNPCRSMKLNDTYPFGYGIHDEWVAEHNLHTIQSEYNWIG